jgi:hypothetical protein
VTAGQVAGLNGMTTNVTPGVVTSVLPIVIPPGLFLVPGWRLRAFTNNIQAGDQWSQIWHAVEEWIDQA